MTLIKALNLALRLVMEEDKKVLLFKDDTGKLGDTFPVAGGVYKDFVEHQVIASSLPKSGIVGTGIGLATRGFRSVLEI